MSGTGAPGNGRDFETVIAAVLRTGVLTSVALLVLGTLLTFARHPGLWSAPLDLAASAGSTVPLADLPAGLAALRGSAVITLGLIVLVLTPVIRVAASLILFLRQRDRRFAAITGAVLLILLLSFLLGKVES
jgi:uncharacterized membrane protein